MNNNNNDNDDNVEMDVQHQDNDDDDNYNNNDNNDNNDNDDNDNNLENVYNDDNGNGDGIFIPAEDYLLIERQKRQSDQQGNNNSSSSSSSSGMIPSGSNLSDPNIRKATKVTIRKPQSTWLIFLGERREVLLKEQPGLPLTQVVRIIGEQFRNLSKEEKDRLELLALQDKERYNKEIEIEAKLEEENKANNPAVSKESEIALIARIPLSIPAARVKRIIKLDPDVKNVSKESVNLICKAVELFVGYLTARSSQGVSLRGSKQVNEYDFLHTVHTNRTLEFLRLDFPNRIKPKKVKEQIQTTETIQIRTAESIAFKNFFNTKSAGDKIDVENTTTNIMQAE
jgi:histone H3/H4